MGSFGDATGGKVLASRFQKSILVCRKRQDRGVGVGVDVEDMMVDGRFR
jgi:hypothetical protein